ncbi:hypothetical protein [Kitasatospora nipponensis]|uniref:hypothetical protein n=1 Tax=Kitasatospora nipponensis TaxID=258049 RepID=UPI0031D4388A
MREPGRPEVWTTEQRARLAADPDPTVRATPAKWRAGKVRGRPSDHVTFRR